MGNHTVDITAVYKKTQTRPAKTAKILSTSPIGLGKDSYPEPFRFKHAGDDCRTEGGVIHVSIPRNQHKIGHVPAKGIYFFFGNGQKRHNYPSLSLLLL